MDKQMIKT